MSAMRKRNRRPVWGRGLSATGCPRGGRGRRAPVRGAGRTRGPASVEDPPLLRNRRRRRVTGRAHRTILGMLLTWGKAAHHAQARGRGPAADRRLPAPGAPRRGRHGTGLPRPVGPGTHRRGEAGARGTGRAGGVPPAVPPGGRVRAPGRRVLDGARTGRRHRGRRAVGRHRVRRRAQPPAGRRAGPRGPSGTLGTDPGGRARARPPGHPRRRHRAPRPQAVQRPRHHRRPPRHRLRHRAGPGDGDRRRAHPHRRAGRLARLHGARAGARRPDHARLRRLLPRLGPRLRRHRRPALRHRQQRGARADVPHRAGGTRPGGRARGRRRPGPRLPAEGPGGPPLPRRGAGAHGRAGHRRRGSLQGPLAPRRAGGPARPARGTAAGHGEPAGRGGAGRAGTGTAGHRGVRDHARPRPPGPHEHAGPRRPGRSGHGPGTARCRGTARRRGPAAPAPAGQRRSAQPPPHPDRGRPEHPGAPARTPASTRSSLRSSPPCPPRTATPRHRTPGAGRPEGRGRRRTTRTADSARPRPTGRRPAPPRRTALRRPPTGRRRSRPAEDVPRRC